MSVDRLVARGVRAIERLMTDACTVSRVTGQTVGITGVITDTVTPVYAGRCRVKTRDTGGRGADIGEAYRIISRRILQLPITVTDVQEGDRVVMTASLDPRLVGMIFTVRSVDAATHATRRECEVIEVSS